MRALRDAIELHQRTIPELEARSEALHDALFVAEDAAAAADRERELLMEELIRTENESVEIGAELERLGKLGGGASRLRARTTGSPAMPSLSAPSVVGWIIGGVLFLWAVYNLILR